MLNNIKKELLLNFPIEKNTKIINNSIISVEEYNLNYLISKWELNGINGESYIFLKEEVDKLTEKVIINILFDIEKINTYKFKYIKNHAFLYFTEK